MMIQPMCLKINSNMAFSGSLEVHSRQIFDIIIPEF